MERIRAGSSGLRSVNRSWRTRSKGMASTVVARPIGPEDVADTRGHLADAYGATDHSPERQTRVSVVPSWTTHSVRVATSQKAMKRRISHTSTRRTE
jgi:hypothetical protein